MRWSDVIFLGLLKVIINKYQLLQKAWSTYSIHCVQSVDQAFCESSYLHYITGGAAESKLGVCGDSAGGLLSATACQELRGLIQFAVSDCSISQSDAYHPGHNISYKMHLRPAKTKISLRLLAG